MAKSTENSVPYWDGSSLGDGPVALCVFTVPLSGQQHQVPITMLAAAASEHGQVFVCRDQLAEFIQQHQSCEIICHDAAKLHWVLLNHFAGDAEASSRVWGFATDGRLIDVMLLDQLVRLARETNGFPEPQGLEAIARRYFSKTWIEAVSTLEERLFEQAGASKCSPDLQAAVLKAVEALWVIHDRMRVTAADITATAAEHVPEADPSFGPLGLKVEVQGAIALAAANRQPLRIDPKAIQSVIEVCDQTFAEARRKLSSDASALICFKTSESGDESQLTEKELLRPDNHKLLNWVKEMLWQVDGRQGDHLPGPMPRDRFITLPTPSRFGAMLDCSPLLRAWADCEWASTVRHLASNQLLQLRKSDYEVIPRIFSGEPDLSVVHHLAPEGLFKPADTGRALVGSFPELELRALAAVLERRVSKSVLAETYRKQGKPIGAAAAALVNFTDIQFNSLPWKRQQAWVQIVTAVIQGMALWLGPPSILNMVRTRTRQWPELTEIHQLRDNEIKEFPNRLCELFPELNEFVVDIYARSARALGCNTVDEVLQNLQKFTGEAPTREELWDWTVKKPGSADDVLNASWWDLYYKQFETEEIQLEDCGGDRTEMVFNQGCGIRTGRRRVAAIPTEQNAEHLDLADAAVKAALFSLVEHGFTLLGFNGQEFAIEVPEKGNADNACAEVRQLASSAAAAVIGGVPVVCDCEPRERW